MLSGVGDPEVTAPCGAYFVSLASNYPVSGLCLKSLGSLHTVFVVLPVKIVAEKL